MKIVNGSFRVESGRPRRPVAGIKRAGLALLDAGRAEAAQVQQRHGHADFGVRVGVNTGKEQTAPYGALRISNDTWRHAQACSTCRRSRR